MGLMTVPMFEYNWVYTMAQIELIAIDVPLVLYDSVKEKKHSRKEMEELTKRWREKKERDIKNGVKFSFGDFINTGKITNK